MFFDDPALRIVVQALNSGFLKTLQLFATTLVGAIPLGLIIAFGSMSRFPPLRCLTKTMVWIIRGTPLMLQLMIIYYVPGLKGFPIWGGGEHGRFLYLQLRLLLLRDLPGRHRGRAPGAV